MSSKLLAYYPPLRRFEYVTCNSTGSLMVNCGNVNVISNVLAQEATQASCLTALNGINSKLINADTSGALLVKFGNTFTISHADSSVFAYGFDSTNSIHRPINTDAFGSVHTKVLNTVSVSIDPTAELTTKRSSAFSGTVYDGLTTVGGYFGSLDTLGYSSADILFKVPANAMSSAGSFYVCVSDDNVTWYKLSSNSVYINTSVTEKTYAMTLSSINTRYLGICTDDWGGASTLNIVVKASLKK